MRARAWGRKAHIPGPTSSTSSTGAGCTTRFVRAMVGCPSSPTCRLWARPPRSGADPQSMSILLVHDEKGWASSQFNAAVDGVPWSAFRVPHPGPRLRIGAAGRRPLARPRAGADRTAVHLAVRAFRHWRAPALAVRTRHRGPWVAHRARRRPRGRDACGVPREGARPLGLAPSRRLGLRFRERSERARRAAAVCRGVHADPATCPGRCGDGIRHGVEAWAPAAALPASRARRRRLRAAPSRPGHHVATAGRHVGHLAGGCGTGTSRHQRDHGGRSARPSTWRRRRPAAS